MTRQTATREHLKSTLPPIDTRERKKVWMKLWGIWKDKKPDPIRVMRKLRKELDRKII